MSNDRIKRRKGVKKRRKENVRKQQPYRYLIICEGKQTEPNYFNGIKKRIESRYRGKIDVRTKEESVDMDVKGTGKNTEDLVDYAIKVRGLSPIVYGEVWVVFDKDDYKDDMFNNAIHNAERDDIKVAWSNEAFELWFVLHFEFLNTAVHRQRYIEKLNGYFKRYGINGGQYNKEFQDVFDFLYNYGDVREAIKRSVKLEKIHKQNNIESEAKMNPCTTVHRLVGKLIDYIE